LNVANLTASQRLAFQITHKASKQTSYTIQALADRERVPQAFQAYAYFRWLDDWIDEISPGREASEAFIARQCELIDACYQGLTPMRVCPEERMLIDLIHSNADPQSGLAAYIRNMMAVMAFDAGRRGRWITRAELDEYTRLLAVAVTEALHHCIGHNCRAPQGAIRYQAVTGAHIVHMLRDAIEDARAGYYNIPLEVLQAGGISPQQLNSPVYRAWVRERVSVARRCFETGRANLARIENLRCRLAGYAYCARFEIVLDAIERDGYWLRAGYQDLKTPWAGLRMVLGALGPALQPQRAGSEEVLWPA
jgi:phytoene/squalene synthetase